MIEFFKIVLAAWVFLAAMTAFSQPVPAKGFDPTDYLKEQEFEAGKRRALESVEASNVVIAGQLYVRLATQQGAIYLPRHKDALPIDLNRGLCGESFKQADLKLATFSAPELSLKEAVDATARLIGAVIEEKCARPKT